MNLFSRKRKAPAPKLSESIQKLQDVSADLDKREKHLQAQIDQAAIEARKKLKAKDKRGALHFLKRKKMYEKQIDQIYGKKTNIDLQIMALEAAGTNKDVLQAMQGGARALQSAMAETNVDKVDEVMEEIQEAMGLQNELDEALSQSIGPPMDEDELAAELAEMDEEMKDEATLSEPTVITSPVTQVPVDNDEKVLQDYMSKPNIVKIPQKNQPILNNNNNVPNGMRSKIDKELADLEVAMGMA